MTRTPSPTHTAALPWRRCPACGLCSVVWAPCPCRIVHREAVGLPGPAFSLVCFLAGVGTLWLLIQAVRWGVWLVGRW